MVTAIVTIVMFLVMVSLHEFGHFSVAKLLGFKVLEYAIGFGPTIFKRQKGETQYSIRAIPLGGYCKFEGDGEDSDDPRAFCNQKAWKRILVIIAGGVSNVILGFVLMLFVVGMASPMRTNVVDSIVPNSYMEQVGVMQGDEIIRINGKHIASYDDITLAKSTFQLNKDIDITVKRGRERLNFTLRPSEQVVTVKYLDDRIETVSTVNGVEEEPEVIMYSDEIPRDEEMVGKTTTSTGYIMGFAAGIEDVNAKNIWGHAFNKTIFVVKLVYQSLWGLVTGEVGIDQMSGPVGIVSEVHEVVNSGVYRWLNILNLVALLTINLGIFNLLPIPALDGGRLVFMIVELIRRKPVPPEKEGAVHAIGFMLLFALILFISFNDIMRLIR